MSRPLKGAVPLAAVLAVRVPLEVAADWRRAAAARGLAMSDWLRQSIDPDAVRITGRSGPVKAAKRRFSPADPSMVIAVNRVGNNINQIARGLNRQALTGERVDLLRCLRVLAEIQHEVTALVVPLTPDKRQVAQC